MWIELLESALIFLFSPVGFARPHPHLTLTSPSRHPLPSAAWLLQAPYERLRAARTCICAPFHFWAELRPGFTVECALAHSACVSHVRPPTLPPLRPPVCLSVCLCVAAKHSAFGKMACFIPCDCDINVSICLLPTWTSNPPTHPKQKHKGPPLVLHNMNFFFLFFFLSDFSI